MQLEAPVPVKNVPGGQFEQLEAPTPEYVPAGQFVQFVEELLPVPTKNVPAGQLVQFEAPTPE